MYSTKLKTWTVRRGPALFCVMLLGGCGLAGGHGSLDSGNSYQDKGEYRAAYIEAKKILQNDSKNGDAYVLLGKASLMMGDPKSALSDLQHAQENGAPKEHWVVPLGRTLLVTQQYEKLLDTITADKSFDPKVAARVAVLRGEAHTGLKQFAQAKDSFQSALKLDPKSARALVGLAKLAAIGKDADSAAKYVQQALTADPESPQAWQAKGDLASDAGDFAGAEAAYQKILGFKNPDWLPQEHFYTLARLANAQAQQNQFDGALATIKTMEKMSPKQPFPHYLRAVVLYKQGHLQDAVTELQQVLQAAPNDSQAQLLMGTINYAQGDYGQAEMNLSNVMGMDKNNVDARKLLALTYFREGRQRQALDTLRPAAPGEASDAQLLAVLQRAAATSPGQPAAAASSAKKVESNPLDTEFARVGKAIVSGNEPEAIRMLEQMPAGNASTEARRNTLLVITYVREKQTDKAVKVAAEYAAKNPNDSGAHLLYGTALVVAKQPDKARAQYNEAVKLEPGNLAALMSLGNLDAMERHYQDAAGHYEAVLKKDPGNGTALTALGRLAMVQGNKADATKWFTKAVDAAPKSTTAYLGLVVLYSQDGQLEQAVSTAKQLVDAVPNNAMALNALGAAQINAGHHDQALKSLQQAVNLAPTVPMYRINLARAQILAKSFTDAERNLDEVIKADPGELTAVGMRAFLKLHDKDLPGAIALAQTLQKQDATRIAGYSLEGDLYMANKSWDKAAKAYAQGLKIQYNRPLVLKRFQALSNSGASGAEGLLTDWLAKNPEDAGARMLLGQYYLAHDQAQEAAGQYEQVLKKYPSNISALNNLAWIYTEQHNPKALDLAAQAHKLAPDAASIADTYGWALLANDQAREALPILERAAKDAPKVAAIQYHLAVAQARTGNKAAARTTLEALEKSGAKFSEKQAADKLYQELGGTSDGM